MAGGRIGKKVSQSAASTIKTTSDDIIGHTNKNSEQSISNGKINNTTAGSAKIISSLEIAGHTSENDLVVGYTNQKVEQILYQGGETATIVVNVDNVKKIITATAKSTPGGKELVNVYYDDSTQKIIFTFNDGSKLFCNLSELINSKQDKLPEGENDQYLHLNADTGEIEWSDVIPGSATFKSIGGDPYDNRALKIALDEKTNETEFIEKSINILAVDEQQEELIISEQTIKVLRDN